MAREFLIPIDVPNMTSAPASADRGTLYYDLTVEALQTMGASSWETLRGAVASPTADRVPLGDGSGKLNDGWLNSTIARLADLPSLYAVLNHNHNASAINAGTLLATRGGTGQGTYAVGDLLVASATDALSRIAIGATARYLRSNGTTPVWTALDFGDLVNKPTTLGGYGITDAVSSTAAQSANTVLAGPTSGNNAAPSWRALVAADIPSLDASKIASGSLLASYGGTGQALYTVGDLLYASASNALSKLADVATGSALISGGVGAAPSWGKIALGTHISGILAPANGGTGINNGANGLTVPATGTAALVERDNQFSAAQGVRAAASTNAGGIYVPWITGDALPALKAGSNNSGNGQIGVQGISYSGVGVQAESTTGTALQALSGDAGYAGIFDKSTATTNQYAWPLRLRNTLASGTVAANFGVGLAFALSSTTTANQSAASIHATWSDPADATRSAFLAFYTVNNAAYAERARLTAAGQLLLRSTTATQAAGLYAPWLSGDTSPTLRVGASTSGNNQNAIAATSDSGAGLVATSASGTGVNATSATGTPVIAVTNDTGTTNGPWAAVLRHTTSGVPAANFGTALSLQAASNGNAARLLSEFGAAWSDATDATRTSYAYWTVVNGGVTAEQMRLTAIGQLLVGLTAPVFPETGRGMVAVRGSSDAGVLELSANIADADAAQVGLVSWADKNSAATDKRLAAIIGSTSGATATNRGGALTFYTKTNNASGLNARMVIDPSGNVGIGTTNPPYPLTVDGLARFRAAGGTRYRTDISVGSGGTTINAFDDTSLVYLPLFLNGSRVIFNQGSVVIGGNYTPTRVLSLDAAGSSWISWNNAGTEKWVAGYEATNAGRWVLYNSVGGTYPLLIDTNSRTQFGAEIGVGAAPLSNSRVYAKGVDATSANYAFYANDSAGTALFQVRNDGYGYLKANAWVFGSDENMKWDIHPVPYGLETVLALETDAFRYTGSDKLHLGFIAQKVQRLVPEAVSTMPDGMLGLAREELFPILWRSVQQLTARVVELERKLT